MKMIGFGDVQYRHSPWSYGWARNFRSLAFWRKFPRFLTRAIAFRDALFIVQGNVGGLRSDKTMPTDFGKFTTGAGHLHPELGIVSHSAYDLVLAPYQS